ncbi:MAG: transporter [Actinomycetales bacterium]|jgi:putative transport protein|nr:transporter [Actinomycetales bacterium]HMT33282.1 TrkA C-terminal domain-containing protein [Dermatophilaceae bacterium]
MTSLLGLFVASPVLTLFACTAVGLLFGKIKIAGISFGAAGALFAALALSGIVHLAELPNPGTQFDAHGQLLPHASVALPTMFNAFALAVFCYLVGVSAGPSILAALRTGWQPILVALAATAATAAAALGFGRLFGLSIGEIGGVFAGAGTATAALGVVQAQLGASGGPDTKALVDGAAVGYGIGYPVGVVVTILFAVLVMALGRRRPTAEDRAEIPPLQVRTIAIGPAYAGELTIAGLRTAYRLVASRVTRGEQTAVARETDRLRPGDLVTVTGRADHLEQAASDLGSFSEVEPWFDRTEIDFRRITLSRPELVTQTVGSLDLTQQFGAVVSRVRRGDLDLLATPDLALQLGDRLRVTAPRQRMSEVGSFLGDSERKAGDINGIGLALGLTIGLLAAFISIPLPGGAALVIGTASGPLIVGTVLGAIGRTGRVLWQLPGTVSATLTQFALLLFLVGVGSGAGEHLVAAVQSGGWVTVLLVNVLTATAHSVVAIVGLRVLLRYGTARTLGGLTGSQLCPGVYGFALERVPDQRVAMGYALLFPVMMVVKVIVDQLLVVFF